MFDPVSNDFSGAGGGIFSYYRSAASGSGCPETVCLLEFENRVDPFTPPLERARVICARGPFELGAELDLLRRERIEVLVSKNAGTPSTYAKVEAARQLGLPLVMVARPVLPPVETVPDVDRALAWLGALHEASAPLDEASSMRRGV